ncbi:MFS general substrate transporter [Aureobasidium subglaciale]|nr:MFS general substrate transporter [Aureobasidium subglaciale]
MASFAAAPPNTHAGGDDEALRTHGTIPMNDTAVYADERVNMEEYKSSVPWWKRVYQDSFTQMMLLSMQSFCGPAMSDAIAGLGGGGLASAQTNNISNAITYVMLALVCFFGGPLVNKLGVKWALVIGAISFPIQGSSYYCNSKFGNQWYIIFGGFVSGIGTGCWYVAESGTIMSLAPSGARGKYLAFWIVARNLGQLVGGAINLSKNHVKGVEVGVTPDTYIAFLIIECLALPFALLISPLERVVRSDGTRILVSERIGTKQELKLIKTTMTSSLIVLSAAWAMWSFFYSGTWSTYLGIYFSYTCLATVLAHTDIYSVGCFGLGFVLDMKSLSQRQRARVGLFVVVILNLGVYIWSIVMQAKFNSSPPSRIDWDDALYPSAFLPYFFVQTTGPLSQSYMYWLLSSFATDAQANVRNGAAFRCLEAVGQAISYGMNTQTEASPMIGFCVSFGLMALATAPMIMLTNKTPDRIPADVILEGQEALDAKIADEPEVVVGKMDQK